MVKNMANALSAARIAAIFPLWWLVYHGENAVAAALVALAGASDWADGHIARRSGRHTALGARLDYLADKLFSLSALGSIIIFWSGGDLLLWWLITALWFTMALYDAFNATVRAEYARRAVAALKRVSLPVTSLSKAKTAAIFVLLVFVSLSRSEEEMLFRYATPLTFLLSIASILLVAFLLVRNVVSVARQVQGRG